MITKCDNNYVTLQLGEDAEFSVRVTPEFSPALVAAAGVAVAVFVARLRFGS
jgi:hypothetical protein